MMRFRETCLACVVCLAWFSAVWSMARPAEGADPPPGVADWSDWEKYRNGVVHPATLIKPEDLARARENVRRYAWDTRAWFDSAWSITWTLDDAYQFHALVPGSPGETVTVGSGWGQRDHRNTDRGATLPYVIRRREGKNQTDLFVSVFAGNRAYRRFVQSVRLLPVDTPNQSDAVAIAVTTSLGTDVVISMTDPKPLGVSLDGTEIATDGRLASCRAARPWAVRSIRPSAAPTCTGKLETRKNRPLPRTDPTGRIDK